MKCSREHWYGATVICKGTAFLSCTADAHDTHGLRILVIYSQDCFSSGVPYLALSFSSFFISLSVFPIILSLSVSLSLNGWHCSVSRKTYNILSRMLALLQFTLNITSSAMLFITLHGTSLYWVPWYLPGSPEDGKMGSVPLANRGDCSLARMGH